MYHIHTTYIHTHQHDARALIYLLRLVDVDVLLELVPEEMKQSVPKLVPEQCPDGPQPPYRHTVLEIVATTMLADPRSVAFLTHAY